MSETDDYGQDEEDHEALELRELLERVEQGEGPDTGDLGSDIANAIRLGFDLVGMDLGERMAEVIRELELRLRRLAAAVPAVTAEGPKSPARRALWEEYKRARAFLDQLSEEPRDD